MVSSCCGAAIIHRDNGNRDTPALYHAWCECSKCGEKCEQAWGGPTRNTMELVKSPNSTMPKLPEWKDLWNNYVSEYMSTHGMRLPEAGMRETHLGFYEHLVRQLSA